MIGLRKAIISPRSVTAETSEPHLHVQLMDAQTPTAAAGVPFRWTDVEIAPGDVDASRASKPATDVIEPGLPANGQVFSTTSPRPVVNVGIVEDRHG